MTLEHNVALNVAELCGWNVDCIVNTIASLLVLIGRGRVPKDLIRNTALREYKCNDECVADLSGVDVSKTIAETKEVFREAYAIALRILSVDELLNLMRFMSDKVITGLSRHIHELTEVPDDVPQSAQINELIGSLLYADDLLDEAMQRFERASGLYERLGVSDRSLFMKAMVKILLAEKRKREAMRFHEEGRHDEEEHAVRDASRLYLESSIMLYRVAHALPEAGANYVLSKCDAAEALASYYFLHGMIDEAIKYYSECYSSAKSMINAVSEEFREIVSLKAMICEAFFKLSAAIGQRNLALYEEAADIFSRIVERGYLEDVMIEAALIAYRGALDSATSVDDALRVYPKYLQLAVKYVDHMVVERYGSFNDMLRELRVVSMDRAARSLGIDESSLRMYLAYKALEKACQEESAPSSLPIKVLTYIAGLGLDPLSLDPQSLARDIRSAVKDFPDDVINTIVKIVERMSRYLSEWIPV